MEKSQISEIKEKINPSNSDTTLNDIIDECYKFLQSNLTLYPSEEHRDYLKEITRFYALQNKDKSSTIKRWQKWSEYRAKYHPERITEKDIPVQIKTGKAFIHGHDKENRPCVVIKQSLHIPGQTDMEEMIRYGFYILEKAFKLAEQTEKKEIVIIVDRVDFGWSNVDKRMIGNKGLNGIIQDYYIEKIHRVYIYPINWIFQTLMKLARPFLSKETIEKMIYINKEADLKQFFTDDNLIKELGGTSDYVVGSGN